MSERTDDAKLSSRFEEALAYAARAHRTQVRKTTDIPYVSHLLSVAALLLEHGGDEDQAIAALLHDTIEDQGGAVRREDVRLRFGDEVVRIVDACSDSEGDPKPPWIERKEGYLAHLATMTDERVRRATRAIGHAHYVRPRLQKRPESTAPNTNPPVPVLMSRRRQSERHLHWGNRHDWV